jgi:predicted TIM-barrel fold metal-dependent hydrolase
MDRLELIDTHIHFWDLDNPQLCYSWLQPEGEDELLGERLEELKGTKYLVDDFIAETRKANVVKAIHVQAALGIDDPVRETEWVQAAADRTGFPHAIVVHSNLKDPRVEQELERHCQFSNVRGLRDFSEGEYLVDPDFHRGYALLEQFNLVASVAVFGYDVTKVRDLARKFPAIPMVIDHCGEPAARDDDYFHSWKRAMGTLAEAENIRIKISGLGMVDHDWTPESIRPWVLSCIETFGPARCVFGTNWPVDKLFSTYDKLIDAYRDIIADFTGDEQRAMFSRNAEHLYRI